MIPAAWVCLFLPLAGALAITLAGNSINRRAAGVIGTGSVAGAFVAAVWSFVEMLSRDEATSDKILALALEDPRPPTQAALRT